MFFSRISKRSQQVGSLATSSDLEHPTPVNLGWLRAFVVTSVFCLFVSVLTFSVWGTPTMSTSSSVLALAIQRCFSRG